jgi:general nucleoside transport system permease protein
VAAVHGSANAALVSGYGYAGILVAFLARQQPLAVIPVSILLGGIGASGGLLQRAFQLPDASTSVLQGILFLSILFSESFQGRRLFRRSRAPMVAGKASEGSVVSA